MSRPAQLRRSASIQSAASSKRDFISRHQRLRPRFSLAILRDPDNTEPASNAKAITKFERAAQTLGIATTVIGRHDLGRLARFDALFIRDNTFINHYTYRFSRRAAAEVIAAR